MDSRAMKQIRKYSLSAVFFIMTVLWGIPLIFAIMNGFKDFSDIQTNPSGLPKVWHFENFSIAFEKGKFAIGFANSGLLAVSSMVLIVFVCSAAAYPISRNTDKFSKFMYNFLTVGLMVPAGLTMIPTYQLLQSLHLINTPYALIGLYIALNTPFTIIAYTGFLRTIPKELDESAQIDGCTKYYTYWKIIFPLLKPITTTIVILVGTQIFNEFINNLLFASKMKTVALSLFNFKGQYYIDWSMMFAGVTISMLPPLIIFLIFQKYFERGLTSGAVKA